MFRSFSQYSISCAIALAAFTASACDGSKSEQHDTAAAVSRDSSSVVHDSTPARASGYLIDRESMGGIKLGMTLQQARDAFPSAKFERTSDGEGVALVSITLSDRSSVTAYAGEDNPEAPIDWSKKIQMLETFSESFHTAEGVHPGSPVADVEPVYGKTKSTETSEIESREYITFERQPSGLTFRLDRSGFLPGDSTARTVGPKGMILSISISST